MDPDPDELAGVVDRFGALTRDELLGAFEDLAARSGTDFDPEALEAAVQSAIDGYYLTTIERNGKELLAVGPAALPRLPDGGEDLPHLLSVEPRGVAPAALAETVMDRLTAEAARAVNEGDDDRVRRLLDVCYDLEAWGPVETDELRERLDAAQ